MDKYEKILLLNNQDEARLMEEILEDKNIPFVLKSYHDSAYDGLWQMQSGWGHIEAPVEFKDIILSIYKEMSQSPQL